MIHELPLTKAPWQQLQQLLDQSFPLPPRDVFERVVQASYRSQRLWIATSPEGGALQGVVMLSPHSKGGHLDILAVAPAARGQGVGRALVQHFRLYNIRAHRKIQLPGRTSRRDSCAIRAPPFAVI